MKKKSQKKSGSWITLHVEVLLTLCAAVTVLAMGFSNLTAEASQFSRELESDYNSLISGYVTTFNILTGQIEEKLAEDPSFEEMNAWLQSREDAFCAQVGADVYDGIALTYKGGYAHSWHYGDYTNYDPATRPWYQQAQEGNGETVIVAPYVTYLDASYFEDDEYILMTVARKYTDDISFDYDLKIGGIKELLTNRTLQNASSLLLYDKEGYILSSSDTDLYAHNINAPDEAVSADFSRETLASAGKLNTLRFAVVDGQWRLLFSARDENGNTLCTVYSFWTVLVQNFAATFLVIVLLLGFEIWLHARNKKITRAFQRKDARLSRVLDASYDENIFVDMATMCFHGSRLAEQLARCTDYRVLYPNIRAMTADEETAQALDRFLSPEAMAGEKNMEGLQARKFNIVREVGGKKEHFVYEFSRMLTQTDGNVVAGIFANDVTEDATILREALREAEQASRAKGTFLAQMSHEIRTPMNAIIGETTLAQKNLDKPEKMEEYLSKIMVASRHLLSLINDILDMSSIESNKLKIARAEFDIKDVVSTITTLYYSQCREKGINFETQLKGVMTEMLIGDQLRIQQVILNLLSNAVKFTPAGGTVLFALQEDVGADRNVLLHITVKDDGCGMSPEYMQRIFKPFEQESALTAKEHGGSGLGLSITKNLAEMMGGSITVDSTEGAGTAFSVEIPCEAAERQIKLDHGALSNMRAIAVDDDADALEYISDVLNHIGIEHDCTQSGLDAVEKITKARNDGRMYDVCLLDWKMEGMSGRQLAAKIRAICGDKPITLVASAYDVNEIRDEIQGVDVDACIEKPVFQSSLFNILVTLSQGKLVKQAEKPENYDFTGTRVLLVDDTEINREIAQELLEMVGFQVDTATDGTEAVEIFEKAEPGTYQAILMDVQMPIMNGYDATRAIRALDHPDAKNICIIAMTANAFAEDIANSLAAGMNDHLSKPIDTDLLYEVLARNLNRGK